MANYRWREAGRETTNGTLVAYNLVDLETGRIRGTATNHPVPLENGAYCEAVVDETNIGTFADLDAAKKAVMDIVQNMDD